MELLRTPNYIIRHAITLEELIRVEQMQIDVWGISNHVEIVPKDILLIVQKNGGLVLGAFDLKGEMIGFLFGFLGRTKEGRFKHCSHMMGVLQEYRHLGIGEQLKRVQREVVSQQGLDLITWTVNPLEGVNASLNFGKLGVICRTFLPNFYGEMEDELNKGLPSDRFEVEWWINSQRVASRLAGGKGEVTLSVLLGQGVVLVNHIDAEWNPVFEEHLPESKSLLLEVPVSLQQIKAASLGRAKDWIDQTRGFFVSAFGNGYVVTEFYSLTEKDQRRNFYLLEKSPTGITA